MPQWLTADNPATGTMNDLVAPAGWEMYGRKFYIFGGQTGAGSITTTCRVWDTDLNTWTTLASLPVGRARAGSERSPVWRHGGSVFGPKPRSYAFNMPKKKYRTALQSALSSKVTDGQLFVVSSLSIDQPKTKVLAKALQLFAAGAQVLVIAGEGQDGLLQAARNLSKVQVVTPDRLNVYDLVRAGTIVIPERALARVKEVWA